jgi:isoleucyl-tRNA synthetase
MPFARFHYPFENQQVFEDKFPAEYIAEGLDQTRGWFYSLMAISTALFDKAPYKQVLVNGMVLADDGQKLSKSKQNYDPPEVLLDQFGADATRINFFSTPISAGEDTTVSASTLKVMTQEYLLPLWNMYSFLVTYANVHQWNPLEDTYSPKEIKNIWLQARMNQTIQQVTDELDAYRIPQAMRHLKGYMDDMSKWYIRTSRADFATGKSEYLATLYQAYVNLLTILAPFAPFITEYLYQALVRHIDPQAKESIHLCDWPQASQIDESLFAKMDSVQLSVEMGFKLRDVAKIKVRQPLAELSIQGVTLEPWMQDIIATEVNVKQVHSEDIQGETLQEQGMRATLDTELTPELQEEGLVREVIRNLQMTRKNQRLSMEQRVKMTIEAPDQIVDLIQNHQAEISEPVGVVEWQFGSIESQEGIHKVKIEGEKIQVLVEVVEA